MDVTERRNLMEQLAAVPGRVRQAAEAAQGRARPPEEWSVNAVVGHLARVDAEVWQARFQQVAAGENPTWDSWEPDGVDWEGEYGGRPLERLLADFESTRQASLRHLEGLDEAGWQRTGTHRRWGRVDVAYLCREMLKHDDVHVGQIRLGG
jgi:DinB superfamily